MIGSDKLVSVCTSAICRVGVCLKIKISNENNKWNLFKVTNKDTRAASLIPLCCRYYSLWTDFTHWYAIFIFAFEQKKTIAGWVIQFRTLHNSSCLHLKIHDFIENSGSYPLKVCDVFALNVWIFLSFLKWNARRKLLPFVSSFLFYIPCFTFAWFHRPYS